MATIPIDCIFYINLDHQTDRRDEIEKELRPIAELLGYPTERFPATFHFSIGAVGCIKSHIAVLKEARHRNYRRVLIVEDDFKWNFSPEQICESLKEIETLTSFNVCMLAANVKESLPCMQKNIRYILEAETGAGYIVNSTYFDVLISAFQEALPKLEKTNEHWNYALDVVWKPLQKQHQWICIHPLLGKQRDSYSDCSNTFSAIEW